MKSMKRINGFTLLEMLLVLAIATSILGMLLTYTTQKSDQLRRDRAVMQFQQILNAALSYYNQKGVWPDNTTESGLLNKNHDLIKNNYLPPGPQGANQAWISPYNVNYRTFIDTTTSTFYVINKIPSTSTVAATSSVIASQLPSGITYVNGNAIPIPPTVNPPYNPVACTAASSNCFVLASIPPPGQNLNNARSVNFASLYHNGACVPVPSCPTGMTAQIMVVPSDVKGVNDQPSCSGSSPSSCSNPSVHPIASYTAYATSNVTGGTPTNATPPPCNTGSPTTCYSSGSTPITTGSYWRVCLQIITDKGTVTPTTNVWGQLSGSVLAITRCAPGSPTPTEPVGSDFTVWAN